MGTRPQRLAQGRSWGQGLPTVPAGFSTDRKCRRSGPSAFAGPNSQAGPGAGKGREADYSVGGGPGRGSATPGGATAAAAPGSVNLSRLEFAS